MCVCVYMYIHVSGELAELAMYCMWQSHVEIIPLRISIALLHLKRRITELLLMVGQQYNALNAASDRNTQWILSNFRFPRDCHICVFAYFADVIMYNVY